MNIFEEHYIHLQNIELTVCETVDFKKEKKEETCLLDSENSFE